MMRRISTAKVRLAAEAGQGCDTRGQEQPLRHLCPSELVLLMGFLNETPGCKALHLAVKQEGKEE